MKTQVACLLLMLIPFVIESYAEELEIKLGETISYENLTLYFYDVEDSRCPSDVMCVWEGKVLAMVHISNATHRIDDPLEIGFTLTYITPYEITLLDVKPYPISTEKPDYVATLDIKNLGQSTCDKGSVYQNGVCVVTDMTYMETFPSVKDVFYLQFLLLIVFSLIAVLPIIGIVYWLKNKKFRAIVLSVLVLLSFIFLVLFFLGIIPSGIT